MKISYPAATEKYYFGPIEYNGGTLGALYHEEGRAVPDGNGGYDYEIKTMKKTYIPLCLCYFFILTGITSCSYFQPPPKIDAEKIRRVTVYVVPQGMIIEPSPYENLSELKKDDRWILQYEINDSLFFKKLAARISRLRRTDKKYPAVRFCYEIALIDKSKIDLCFDNSGKIMVDNYFYEPDSYLRPLIESYLPESYLEVDSLKWEMMRGTYLPNEQRHD